MGVTVAALLLLAGCSNAGDGARDESGTASPSRTATRTPAPSPTTKTPKQAQPEVGQCYRLDYQSATSPTSAATPVPCSGPHSAVTMYVGTIDAVDDGHLLAVDSAAVQKQLADTCPGKVAGWVGGDDDTRRLSQFKAVWFSPTLADSDAGATWFRCDLVSVRAPDSLARIPGNAKGALDADDALDRFGTCGTAAPSEPAFRRVICSEKHSWQAVTVLPIAKDAAYLGKDAQATADDACKVEAQQRATDPTVYKWSFEWPAKADWDAGRRYGLCWVPAT